MTELDEPLPPPEPEPRRSPALLVLGAVIAAAGVAWLLAALGAIDVPLLAAVALGLLLVGLALVLAPRGGHVGVLVVLGILLALVGGAAAAIGVDPFEGGVGERVHRPASAGELEREHELGIGRLELDLTDVDPQDLDGTVSASVGIGELVVLVPRGLDVEVRAEVGMGDAQVLGRQQDGFDVRLDSRADGTPELRLELEAGIGSLRVAER